MWTTERYPGFVAESKRGKESKEEKEEKLTIPPYLPVNSMPIRTMKGNESRVELMMNCCCD
jgi:hypothetical protein